MSSIVGAITGGGGSGVGFKATSANILNPATVAQADEQYTNAQTGLQNQADFLTAVQGQNGLGNQTSTYNQLQGIANGTGPNPAQAMLNQATGANTANQAALMAGQRGSGANAGLIARQAAQQGAANQQNSAGQAATMQANQSLGALGQMGSLATNQANQQANATNAYSASAQNEQQNILNAIAAQNNANVGMASNMNSTNENLAGTVAAQQGNMLGNLMGGLGSALPMMSSAAKGLFGGGGGGGAATVAGGAGDAMGAQGAAAGVGADLSSAAPLLALGAKGGKVPSPQRFAGGGSPAPGSGTTQLNVVDPTAPKSKAGQYFSNSNDNLADPNSNALRVGSKQLGQGIGGMFGSSMPVKNPNSPSAPEGSDTMSQVQAMAPQGNLVPTNDELGVTGPSQGDIIESSLTSMSQNPDLAQAGGSREFAKGGKVPALVSPGEIRIHAKDVKKVAEGKKSPMSGEKIPGKAVVKGAKNSYANDTVPKTLNEGDIILPRSVTQSKNPHWAAHQFVSAIMAKQGTPTRKPK